MRYSKEGKNVNSSICMKLKSCGSKCTQGQLANFRTKEKEKEKIIIIHFRLFLFDFVFVLIFIFQQTTTESIKGLDPTPTTEKYRVYRKELGYMLGRNYRGLKKLFNIELQDALNVSNTNTEYQLLLLPPIRCIALEHNL